MHTWLHGLTTQKYTPTFYSDTAPLVSNAAHHVHVKYAAIAQPVLSEVSLPCPD